MKKIFQIMMFMAAAVTLFNSCKEPDPVTPNTGNTVADILVNIPGVKNLSYNATFSANKDTAYINMPFFYPEESDNAINLQQLLVRANLPLDAKISPALGQMDVSKPINLTITSGSGETSHLVLVVRKVADLAVKTAKIQIGTGASAQSIDAILNNNEILFFIVPGVDVSHAELTITVNKHSSVSVPSGSVINLSNPVPITVTGVDNTTRQYTLKAQEPAKLAYGVGITRKLWTKIGSEVGGGGIGAHTETSLAVSGENLILVTNSTPSRYKVFNRMTGEYIKDMVNPAVTGYRSFQLAADSAGHLLSTTYAGTGGKFYLYRYNDANDSNPVKLGEWTNTTSAGGMGRRVRVYGDLSKDALILATGGQTKLVHKWRVVNGALVSATPEVITYESFVPATAGAVHWNFLADAQPTGASATANYFINYNAEIALVNGATNQRIAAFDVSAVNQTFHAPTSYFRFNNANCLAVVEYLNSTLSQAKVSVFDVTDVSKLSMTSANPEFSKFKIFSSESISGASNGNGTGDVCAIVSSGGATAEVYMLLTNGGILANQLTVYTP